MKKLFPVFIILMSLTMTGCLMEDNSAEIAELEKEIEALKTEKPEEKEKEKDVFFERNMKCLEAKDSAISELKDWTSSPEIEAIFYSPLVEECMILIDRNHGVPYSDKQLYRLSDLTRSGHSVEGCMEEGYFSCRKFAEDILEKYKKSGEDEVSLFSLDINSLSYELPEHSMLCLPNKRKVCSSEKCSNEEPRVFLAYNEKENLLYRCDSKPCDVYEVIDSIKGFYRNLRSTDKDVRVKIQDSDFFEEGQGDYVEITGAGLGVSLSFGHCEIVNN